MNACFLSFDISKVGSNLLNYIKFGIEKGGSSCCSTRAYSIEDMVSFFIYNTLSIFLILSLLIFIISIIKSYFPPEKVGKYFKNGKKVGVLGNIIGALLGVVTPFCSCSAVSIFIGFVESGVPLGATFSFLVAAPMVNEVALVMIYAMFGLDKAILYMVAGIIIAVISGLIIGKLDIRKYVEDYVFENRINIHQIEDINFKHRIIAGFDYVKFILKKVWVYIIVGMIIGAYMHGYIPSGLLTQYIQKDNPLGVVIATVVGIPIYSNAAGIIPIVKELIRLGVPIGTGLAFMMGVTALSLPEIIILRNVMKPKLLAMFVGIVAVSIIFVGYLFNLIL